MARFSHSIVAVKEVDAYQDEQACRRVHIFFQSTPSCKISTVNTLRDCKIDVSKRGGGLGSIRGSR